MDFLTAEVKPLYRKYLIASIESALAMSIYSFVDTVAIGQSTGPMGTAAMAAITPLYGVLTFLGVLCGIGGAVLMNNAKGAGQEEKENEYFTAALILMAAIIVVGWLAFLLFNEPILTFFGANEETMPYVMEYAVWIIRFFPVFIAPTFLGAFLRNDDAPGLAMGAVVAGGVLNIFGDWFLCFPMDMDMAGAAIATVTGTCLQVVVMCAHFFRKKCSLKLVKPFRISVAFKKILSIGFGSSVLDLGTVLLTIIINSQINRYGNVAVLSVYGMISAVSSLFQALFSGVGQAIQPLVSANYGAGQVGRFKAFFRMSLLTVVAMGILFTAIGELFPVQLTTMIIAATSEVLEVAPFVVRTYFLLFPFLGLTVLSTYYLQSIMRGNISMVIAGLRSIVLSGILLFVLPLIFGLTGVLIALPVSDLIVALIAMVYIRQTTKKLA